MTAVVDGLPEPIASEVTGGPGSRRTTKGTSVRLAEDTKEMRNDTAMDHETSSLLAAAEKGDLNLLEKCLSTRKCNINARDQQKNTALHYAASKGSEPIVRSLLKAGADPNVRGPNGCTPLHCAVQHGDSATLVELLVAAGADSQRQDWDGDTPLALAKKRKRAQILRRLEPTPSSPTAPVSSAKDTVVPLESRIGEVSDDPPASSGEPSPKATRRWWFFWRRVSDANKLSRQAQIQARPATDRDLIGTSQLDEGGIVIRPAGWEPQMPSHEYLRKIAQPPKSGTQELDLVVQWLEDSLDARRFVQSALAHGFVVETDDPMSGTWLVGDEYRVILRAPMSKRGQIDTLYYNRLASSGSELTDVVVDGKLLARSAIPGLRMPDPGAKPRRWWEFWRSVPSDPQSLDKGATSVPAERSDEWLVRYRSQGSFLYCDWKRRSAETSGIPFAENPEDVCPEPKLLATERAKSLAEKHGMHVAVLSLASARKAYAESNKLGRCINIIPLRKDPVAQARRNPELREHLDGPDGEFLRGIILHEAKGTVALIDDTSVEAPAAARTFHFICLGCGATNNVEPSDRDREHGVKIECSNNQHCRRMTPIPPQALR